MWREGAAARARAPPFLPPPAASRPELTHLNPPPLRTQVVAVVSQPGKPKGRGNKATPVPSPVESLARKEGLPDDRILCPTCVGVL